jgi:hypothetical protein
LHLLFQRADVEPFLLDEVHHRFLPLPLLLLVEPTTPTPTPTQGKCALPSVAAITGNRSAHSTNSTPMGVSGASVLALLPCLRQPSATASRSKSHCDCTCGQVA